MRQILAALLIGLSFVPQARAQQSGLYDVTGINLDGTPYTGLAQIRQSGLASFTILWRIGNDVIEGVGFASGRTISVAYGLAQRPGIGIYALNTDGSMDGEWTIIGAGAIGRERLVLRGASAAPAETLAAPPPATETPATPATPGR